MRTFKSTFVLLLLIIGTVACNEDLTNFAPDGAIDSYENEMLKAAKYKKATGSVEIEWMGGGKKSEMGNQPENLRAFFALNAQETKMAPYSKGEIVFQVTDQDLILHREIKANVFGVKVDTDQKKAWIVARVFSDTKGCNGEDGSDGHDSGCSDEHTDDGGCSDDHTDEGGCSDDHTDEGGCTDEHTDGESCADSHTDIESDHASGSKGSAGKGNPLSGKNCRLNQIIVIKVHDVGTPGIAGDGLTWKWFMEETAPKIEAYSSWQHLCKKTIIGGNLVVHK